MLGPTRVHTPYWVCRGTARRCFWDATSCRNAKRSSVSVSVSVSVSPSPRGSLKSNRGLKRVRNTPLTVGIRPRRRRRRRAPARRRSPRAPPRRHPTGPRESGPAHGTHSRRHPASSQRCAPPLPQRAARTCARGSRASRPPGRFIYRFERLVNPKGRIQFG
jgi:hypothetical protein